MEELTIEGKTYISSKKAAKITGYAKDYVGQLCREGRVEAKLVGRSWYVYEPSLNEHRFNDERKHKASEVAEVEIPAVAAAADMDRAHTSEPEEPIQSEITNIQAVWEPSVYRPEPLEILPEIEEKMPTEEPIAASSEEEQGTPVIAEMQSAWQDWFSVHPIKTPREIPQQAYTPSVREIEAPQAVAAPEMVTVRPIVSDITPARPEYVSVPLRPIRPAERKQAPVHSSSTLRKLGGAVTIAIIVLTLSVTLVATGLFELLHVGGVSETPIIQFLQGSNVIEK